MPVLFNLLFEAEPYAVILIAHGTHGRRRPICLDGGTIGSKFQVEGRQWGGIFEQRATSPSHAS